MKPTATDREPDDRGLVLAAQRGDAPPTPATVGVVVTRVLERQTKAGEWMAVVWLEDETARREAVCFPRAWAACGDAIEAAQRDGAVLLADVQVDRAGDKLVVEAVRRLHPNVLPPDDGPPLGDFVVLDLETTDDGCAQCRAGGDLDVEHQRIVEVGVASFKVRRYFSVGGTGAGCDLLPVTSYTHTTFSRLFDPGCPISAGSHGVHGITATRLREAGAGPLRERADGLVKALSGKQVVTYNGRRFDLPVLAAELRRAGAAWAPDAAASIDVYDFVRKVYRGAVDARGRARQDRPQSRRLGDQCAWHGVPLAQAHSAKDDALATGLLLLKLRDGGWAPKSLARLRAEVLGLP